MGLGSEINLKVHFLRTNLRNEDMAGSRMSYISSTGWLSSVGQAEWHVKWVVTQSCDEGEWVMKLILVSQPFHPQLCTTALTKLWRTRSLCSKLKLHMRQMAARVHKHNEHMKQQHSLRTVHSTTDLTDSLCNEIVERQALSKLFLPTSTAIKTNTANHNIVILRFTSANTDNRSKLWIRKMKQPLVCLL
jgi:hypothetical protein